jgi:rod shape-determining protein MreD
MAKYVLTFIAMIFAVVLFQTLFADLVTIGFARPDLIIVITVWLTLSKDLLWGSAFAFSAGFLEDSHNPDFLGLGALVKVLSAIVIYLVSHRVRTDSYAVRIGMIAVVAFVHDIIYFFVVYAFDPHLGLLSIVNTILPSAAYTAFVGAGILYLSERRLVVKFEA